MLTPDGLLLESRWDLPSGPILAVVVVCHPHPLLGGNMEVPLLRTLAAGMAAAGGAVLRFNFRGTGASQGAWSGGRGEVEDVGAAVGAAADGFPGRDPALVGWSFGAVTALRWQARAGGNSPYVGIAPADDRPLGEVLPRSQALAPARRLFLLGDRDQFTTADELSVYAQAVGAALHVFPGVDHYFLARERQVTEAVNTHLQLSMPLRTD